jgi:hypothetical protein
MNEDSRKAGRSRASRSRSGTGRSADGPVRSTRYTQGSQGGQGQAIASSEMRRTKVARSCATMRGVVQARPALAWR